MNISGLEVIFVIVLYLIPKKVRFDNLELRNRKSKYDGWVTYDLTEEPMPPTIQILPTIQTTTSDTTTTTVHADEIALETAV